MNNIEITTATKLNDEDLQSLSNIISQKLQLSPKINTSIDTKIIGGIKLRVGNNIFDNSIHSLYQCTAYFNTARILTIFFCCKLNNNI